MNAKITPNLTIAVITYKRKSLLIDCINNIRKHTKTPFNLIVADDGGNDGTVEWCKENSITVITGENSGVVWNKNRALAAAVEIFNSATVILLEEDCWPALDGWEAPWIEAASLWGHINYAHPIHMLPAQGVLLGGAGTASDPYATTLLTGQCTACSSEALKLIGYLDTRFKGYGWGHVEWTERFIRNGLGTDRHQKFKQRTFLGLSHGLEPHDAKTFANTDDIQRNGKLRNITISDPDFRQPWRTEAQKHKLLKELQAAFPTMQNSLDRLAQKFKILETNEAADELQRKLKTDLQAQKSETKFLGYIDTAIIENQTIKVQGWSTIFQLNESITITVRHGTMEFSRSDVKPISRPDVKRALGASENDYFGFDLAFPAAIPLDESMPISDVTCESASGLIHHVKFGEKSRPTSPDVPEWVDKKIQEILNNPSMPQEEHSFLKGLLQNAECYIEYGTGNSTVLASSLGIKDILAVESDDHWLKNVAYKCQQYAPSTPTPLHVDIGKTKEWGHPVDRAKIDDYWKYPAAPWLHAEKKNLNPDLILIDGRFRVACFLTSLLNSRPGCKFLFDDYVDRPQYHCIEKFIKPEKIIGRSAYFEKPQSLEKSPAIISMLMQHITRSE